MLAYSASHTEFACGGMKLPPVAGAPTTRVADAGGHARNGAASTAAATVCFRFNNMTPSKIMMSADKDVAHLAIPLHPALR